MRYLKMVCLSILLFAYSAHAQSKKDQKAAERREILEAVKNGTTYIIVNHKNFPGHDYCLAQLQQHWTLTKGLQYITMHDGKFDTPVLPGDSFVDLGSSAAYVEQNMLGYGLSQSAFCMRFSAFTGKGLKSDDHTTATQRYFISAVNFDRDHFLEAWEDPVLDHSLFFSPAGYPGMLLNYMQQLAADLKPDSADAHQQVKNLLKDTLYIPDFYFFKGSKASEQHVDEAKLSKILKKYALPYATIPREELDKKILLSPTPFYYVLHDTGGTVVVNSVTGEMVYFARPSSHELDRDDLEKLSGVVVGH